MAGFIFSSAADVTGKHPTERLGGEAPFTSLQHERPHPVSIRQEISAPNGTAKLLLLMPINRD